MARLARLILEFEKLQLVVTVIAAAAPLCHVLMSRVMIVRAQSCHTVMSHTATLSCLCHTVQQYATIARQDDCFHNFSPSSFIQDRFKVPTCRLLMERTR